MALLLHPHFPSDLCGPIFTLLSDTVSYRVINPASKLPWHFYSSLENDVACVLLVAMPLKASKGFGFGQDGSNFTFCLTD